MEFGPCGEHAQKLRQAVMFSHIGFGVMNEFLGDAAHQCHAGHHPTCDAWARASNGTVVDARTKCPRQASLGNAQITHGNARSTRCLDMLDFDMLRSRRYFTCELVILKSSEI